MVQLTSDPDGQSPRSPGRRSGDTVRMPWTAEGGITDTVVRPALAVLFRMAVGPAPISTSRTCCAAKAIRGRRRGGCGRRSSVRRAGLSTASCGDRHRLCALLSSGWRRFSPLEPVLGGSEAGLVGRAGVRGRGAARDRRRGAGRAAVASARARDASGRPKSMGERADRVATLLAGRNPTSLLHGAAAGIRRARNVAWPSRCRARGAPRRPRSFAPGWPRAWPRSLRCARPIADSREQSVLRSSLLRQARRSRRRRWGPPGWKSVVGGSRQRPPAAHLCARASHRLPASRWCWPP